MSIVHSIISNFDSLKSQNSRLVSVFPFKSKFNEKISVENEELFPEGEWCLLSVAKLVYKNHCLHIEKF